MNGTLVSVPGSATQTPDGSVAHRPFAARSRPWARFSRRAIDRWTGAIDTQRPMAEPPTSKPAPGALGLVPRLLLRRFDRLAGMGAARRERYAFERLIVRNRQSRWGRLQDFKSFRSIGDFVAGHPLTTYDDYKPLIDEQIVERDVRRNVLSRGKVHGLFITSGTTAEPKLIPFCLRPYVVDGILLGGLLERHHGGGRVGRRQTVMLNTWRAAEFTSHGLAKTGVGDAEAVRWLKLGERRVRRATTAPVAVNKLDAYAARLWFHALFSLRRTDVRRITAAFAPAVVDLLRTIEAEHVQLVEAIRTGRVPEAMAEQAGDVRLPPAAPARADALAAVFAGGFEGIVPRLWPAMQMISGIATGPFTVYQPIIARYAGGVPIVTPAYAASEGIFGLPDRSPHAFVPNVVNNYFEFIPEDALDQARPATRTLEQVETGGRYEPVVSTAHGFYRYRSGDLIEIVDRTGTLPRFTVVERIGHQLNLRGEKVAVGSVAAELAGLLGSGVMVDLAVHADADRLPPGYVVYLEVAGDRADDIDPEALADRLNAALTERELGYQEVWRRGLVSPAVVRPVAPGTFAELRQQAAARAGTPDTRQKPRRVIAPADAWMLGILRARVIGGESRPDQ